MPILLFVCNVFQKFEVIHDMGGTWFDCGTTPLNISPSASESNSGHTHHFVNAVILRIPYHQLNLHLPPGLL